MDKSSKVKADSNAGLKWGGKKEGMGRHDSVRKPRKTDLEQVYFEKGGGQAKKFRLGEKEKCRQRDSMKEEDGKKSWGTSVTEY